MAERPARPAPPRWWGGCAALLIGGLLSAGGLSAQDAGDGSGMSSTATAPPPAPDALSAAITPGGIYVLSQERLFSESAFGRRVQAEIQRRRRQLAEENDRIAARLEAEELDLTERRPGMDPAAFRELADAFDRKVEEIRTRQARKNADLNAWAEAEQRRFFKAALAQVVALAQELRARMILDDRLVIVSSGQADITSLLIRRVDAELGDGAADAPPVWPASPEEADASGQAGATGGGNGADGGDGARNGSANATPER